MKSLPIAAVLTLALAGAALAQDYLPPPAVTLSVDPGRTTAVASWSAPGDQCSGATCAEYDLRYSTSVLTECNFTSGTRVSTTSPLTPSSTECQPVEGLTCNTTYYWAVKTKDSSGNWSAMSNVVTRATTGCSNTPEVTCVNILRSVPGDPAAVRSLIEVDAPSAAPLA